MSLRYKKKKIVLNFDKDKKEKYVAANVLVGSINYEKLCDEVNQKTGMHRAQVSVALGGLSDVMISFLEEGFSVKFGEFGSFRPAINAESQDKEEDVNAGTIIRKKIVFTPGPRLQQMLNNASVGQFSSESTKSSDGGNEEGGGGDSGGEAPDPTA